MSAPRVAECFHLFPDFVPELRLLIWQKAMPEYGTVPAASIIKNRSASNTIDSTEAPTTPSRPKVTWALEALPRRQWPNELKLRTKTTRSLYNVNYEARQDVKERFPAVLRSKRGHMFFNPTHDLILLARSLSLDTLFMDRKVSIIYVGNWNRSINKLAIEHDLLAPFWANSFQEPSLLTSMAHDVVRGFMGGLNQLTNLKQFSLVNSQKVSLPA